METFFCYIESLIYLSVEKMKVWYNCVNVRPHWKLRYVYFAHYVLCVNQQKVVFSSTNSSEIAFKMFSRKLPWESDGSEGDEPLLLLTLISNNNNAIKRKWVHEMNTKDCGEIHHLLKQLHKDELKFKEYFRISINKFNQLLTMKKKNWISEKAFRKGND